MNNIRKIYAAVLSVSFIITAGCSAQEMDTVVQETIALSQTTAETTSETEITEEEAYMEKWGNDIAELMPEGYEVKREDVKYSEFQKYTYYSRTAERDTPVNILLPPDYSEDKEYPVVYILHGFYDNEDWMARPIVNLSTIYGNLLSDGKAEEMIIVLPYIFCDKQMPYCTGMDLANCFAYDNFINDLTTDLMPFVESNFSAAKGRENTAVTGFSMGGRESLYIGFMHPDIFGYVGAVCPAPGLVEIPNSAMHPGQMSSDEMNYGEYTPYAVLISSSDADGVVGGSPDSYRNIMTENNVDYLSHVMKTTGHDQSSVMPHLYNYFQLLFRQ